ncbi:MAG: hypothetical protein JRG73_11610 [Deltaproteobacteria bacterium]|nr:hypothetical protein [Deltaproteobacteria bacterium]
MLICTCAALLVMAYHSAGLSASTAEYKPLPCLAGLEKMVSFDLRDADVVTIIDLLARESGVNIVISPHVQDRITIRLENVSRWEALRYVVETVHLRMKVDGCVLRIYAEADIDIEKNIIAAEARLSQREKEAEIMDKEAEARRKRAEAARVERAAAPLVTRSVPVRFVRGKNLAKDLQKLIAPPPAAVPGAVSAAGPALISTGGQLLRPETPFVIYNADANSIIIRDTQERVAEMLRLIKELDRETRQVLIEAKIVETNRNFTRDLGIQWGFLARGLTDHDFPATWGIQGGHVDSESAAKPFLSSPLSGAGNWVVNFPFAQASLTRDVGSALGMTFANVANTFALDIQLSAAEQKNDIRILSNPRILTSDNQQAIIKSGEEVPFQTVDDDDVKIEFKEAVIQLEVTPHIVSEDMINLEVRVKKDEPSRTLNVLGNPFIFKKEAKTRILMKDGDTLVIGGLTTNRHEKIDQGVPWLSRIPVIKHLFRHTNNLQQYEEIMVFITPRMAPRLVSEAEKRKDKPEGGNN